MVIKGRGTYGEIAEVGDGLIEVGNFCSIAGKVIGVTVGHNPYWVTTYPFPAREIRGNYPEAKSIEGHPTRANIRIGNDVWIGHGAMIIAPAVISSGAIIGAGSVVRGIVYPYTIVYGNPAKPVRKRFSDLVIADLVRIAWWNWPDDKIRANLKLLCSTKVEDFIDAHSKVPKKRVCAIDDRIGETLSTKSVC